MIKINKINPHGSLYVLQGIGTVLYQGTDHEANVFTQGEAEHIARLLNRECPPLPSDAGKNLPPHCYLERRIVWNLIQHILASGNFGIYGVNNGEEVILTRDPIQAMEDVFSVDESSLRFMRKDYLELLERAHALPESAERAKHITHAKKLCEESWRGVLLVAGNEQDIISDWNYHKDDVDGFNALMEKFDVEAYL